MFKEVFSKDESAGLDEWESVGGTLSVKPEFGNDEVIIGTPVTKFAQTGEEIDADAGNNQGANIEFANSTWNNKLVLGANISSSAVLDNQTGFTIVGDSAGQEWAILHDGFEAPVGNPKHLNGIAGGSPDFIVIDFTTAKTLIAADIFWYNDGQVRNANTMQLFGSNDSGTTGFVDVTGLIDTSADSTTTSNVHQFTNTIAYRWWKLEFISGNDGPLISEIGLHEGVSESTLNTVDADLQITTANMAPATLLVKNEVGVNITGTGKLNIAYNKNLAGYTSLVDIESFRALDASLFTSTTSLSIRIQPVGLQEFTDICLFNTSSKLSLKKDGTFQVVIDGEVTQDIATKTNAPTITNIDNSAPYNASQDETIIVDVIDGTAMAIQLPDNAPQGCISIKTINTGGGVITIDSAVGDSVASLLVQSGGDTNGSTTFTDSSASGHTITPNDNTQHSTAQAQFGTSSILFDGTDDYLTTPQSTDFDFGTNDFTIRLWLYDTGAKSLYILISSWSLTVSERSWRLQVSNDRLNFTGHDGTSNIGNISGSTVITKNVWHHVAVSKIGDTYKIFLDGALEGSVVNATAINATTNGVRIGDQQINPNDSGDEFTGHMEDIEVVKGTGLYPSPFTPPTSPATPGTVSTLFDGDTDVSSITLVSGVTRSICSDGNNNWYAD